MPDIRHLVFIKSPPEKIYAAISTQEGIAAWWSPFNNIQSKTGSIFRISFGGDYSKEIKVAKLLPQKTVGWEILDANPEWLDTRIEFEIHPENGTSILKFNHSGWKEYTDMFAQCNHHWGVYLQNLKIFCEKGKALAMAEYF